MDRCWSGSEGGLSGFLGLAMRFDVRGQCIARALRVGVSLGVNVPIRPLRCRARTPRTNPIASPYS
jgi:hypothetical protein